MNGNDHSGADQPPGEGGDGNAGDAASPASPRARDGAPTSSSDGGEQPAAGPLPEKVPRNPSPSESPAEPLRATAPPAEPEENVSGDPPAISGAVQEAPKAEEKGNGRECEQDGAAGRVKVKKSKLKNFNVSHGENTFFAKRLTVLGDSQKEARRTPRPLLELTSALPAPEAGAAEFAPGEVEPRHRRLMTERLLFISCVDAAVGRAAAHAVVDGLGAAPGEARLLNFDRLATEDAPETIYDVIRAPGERLSDMLVVVDAVSHRAQPFLDHLLDARNGLWSASSLRDHLRDARLLMVCLAPQERLGGAGRADTPFPHWAVSFLEHVLAAAFPAEHRELRESILRQQTLGRWSRHEGVFCGQLRAALAGGTLKEVVAAGGPAPAGEVAMEEEKPVHNAVLYTAGFFSRLSPADFSRVVTALLGDETMPVPAGPAAVPAPAALSAPAPISLTSALPPMPTLQASTLAQARLAAPREKRLAQVWQESGDRILKECRLAVLRDEEGGRTVGFADPGARDRLREHLEGEYAFSLQSRFAALDQAGLLFDRSDAVAKNMVRLTAGMAAADPDTYDSEWLVQRFADALSQASDSAPVFRRFAELLRGMCEHEVLQPVVAEVMERLLSGRNFLPVLALVRRLRFAPGFDEFYWLRQLMDRGPEEVAEATVHYLYGQLVAAGPQVHPILHALHGWLPPDGLDPDRYPNSGRYVLQLLVAYAADAVDRLKLEDYGAWPSRYPLLAISTPEAVARDLPLVVGWLLHPGLPEVLPQELRTENEEEMMAALLAEWVFILFGPEGKPTEAPAASAMGDGDGAGSVGPDALLAALVTEIAARTADRRGRARRQAMLDYWEEFKELMAILISERGAGSAALLANSVWKRRLLRVLLLRIRSCRNAAEPAAVPAAV